LHKKPQPLILEAELYRATFSYSDTDLKDRPGFSLYVDEFQNFPSKDFAELFAEGRKFGIRMCVSHQRRDQLDEDNRNATRSAGTLVCFTATSDIDARSMASAFVDQNATIRPNEAVRDVLKHLSDHPSEQVQSFLRTYIEVWRVKSKEAITIPMPGGLPRFENYGSLLAFLEKIMYLAQTDGFFTSDNWQSPLKKMLFDFEYACSYLFGFSDYYLSHYHKSARKRKTLEDAASAKIAKLGEELAKKVAVLNNDTDFLGLLVDSYGFYSVRKHHSDDWQKEQTLNSKRQGVLEVLRGMVYTVDNEHPIDTRAMTGRSVEEVRASLNIIAEVNARLCNYDTPEKICAIRRYYVGGRLAELERERSEMMRKFCEMIGWRSSTSPIKHEREMPSLVSSNHADLYHSHIKYIKNIRKKREADDLCIDIIRIDEPIYELKKYPLDDRLMRGHPFEPASLEAIANFCKFLSTFNTPEKMLEALKQEYDQLNLEPLREEIAQVQKGLEADLAAFEQQLEREKPRCEAFVNSLWDCLYTLSVDPIVEKKPLTASDVAQILEQLPKRHVLVRTSKANPNDEHEPTVFLITTLDVPEHVEQSVFEKRMEDIIDRTRAKYCRPRLEVEQELAEQRDTERQDEDIGEGGDNDYSEHDIRRFEDDD
jgi:hypothetical protein